MREAPGFHTNVPIEIAAVNEAWEKEIFQATVSGEYAQVDIQTAYLPQEIIFNPRNKLNGARMDNEVVLYPDTNFSQTLRWVEMRIKKNELSDSARVFVSHIWAAPEPELGDNIDEITTTHYWEINGSFPELTDIEARIFYRGNDETDLDYNLSGESEEGILPLYRPDSSTPWEEYPDYDLFQGGMTNGNGYAKLYHLRKGQYTFGRGTSTVFVSEQSKSSARIYPNPANDYVHISNLDDDISQAKVFDIQGKLIMQQNPVSTGQLDISGWNPGTYQFVFYDEDNRIILQTNLKIVR